MLAARGQHRRRQRTLVWAPPGRGPETVIIQCSLLYKTSDLPCHFPDYWLMPGRPAHAQLAGGWRGSARAGGCRRRSAQATHHPRPPRWVRSPSSAAVSPLAGGMHGGEHAAAAAGRARPSEGSQAPPCGWVTSHAHSVHCPRQADWYSRNEQLVGNDVANRPIYSCGSCTLVRSLLVSALGTAAQPGSFPQPLRPAHVQFSAVRNPGTGNRIGVVTDFHTLLILDNERGRKRRGATGLVPQPHI